MFGSLSASDLVCFAVVAQNIYLPTCQLSCVCKARFPNSETPLSTTLKRLASSAPGRLPPQNGRGGVYCVAGAFFALLSRQGAFTLDFATLR